ncbi:MAG: hypothetical protein K2M20_10605, partial [Lachnospiraceae bacterium]|nr:hypothetical protein [Lachnospiraceae bacterium]
MMFYRMGQERKGISKRKKGWGRAFALLLSLALCAENASLTVLAAQTEAAAETVSGEGEPDGSNGQGPSVK